MLFVDSRGEVDTQEAAPTSLFGDPPNSEETQMPSEERAEETLEQGTPTQLNTTGNDTAEGGTDRPAGQLPSYWHPRESHGGGRRAVLSRARRGSTLGEPQEPLSAEPGTQELEDALAAHKIMSS